MSDSATSDGGTPDAPTRVGHCKRDECTVYIGRTRSDGELRHMNNTPTETRGWLGNPYPLDDGYSREESVAKFVEDLLERVDSDPEFREALYELQGETLGCWCQNLSDDGPLCHGEPLSRVIDAIEKQ